MERYLSTRTSASSDDIILAPYWINPKATNASKNIEEFKLQSKHYLRVTSAKTEDLARLVSATSEGGERHE